MGTITSTTTSLGGQLYGDPVQSANNVTCVPRQKKCYDRGELLLQLDQA